MAIDFYGPNLKVERADQHIGKLEAIFGQYVRDNMKRLRPERKHRLLKQGQTGSPFTFPKHAPTVLGDAIHNLRASLDHAYHIMAEASDLVFDQWRRFPFGEDRKSLEGSINGHKKLGIAPSDKIIAAVLDDMQPYENGKLGLYGLHRLDITDKHLVLIPTVLQMKTDLDFFDASGAKTGTMQGITMTIGEGQRAGEFMQLGGGLTAKPKSDPKDAFKIVFGGGQPFEGDSILDTVRSLKTATIVALDILLKAAS